MSNPTPKDNQKSPAVQQAIGSALKKRLEDTAAQPPPEEFVQILAKVDRRSRLTPKH